MVVCLDTSVLVAGLVESHPDHEVSFPWLRRAKEGEVDAAVCAHSVAELYSVLTSLPLSPPVSPRQAARMIRETLLPHVQLHSLPPEGYVDLVDRVSEAYLTGGITYDALIAETARRAGAERIVTLNGRDFARLEWLDSIDVRSP